jgi:hypothetical protein
VQFAAHGESLQATVRWAGVEGTKAPAHAAITYHDGKLYNGLGLVLDANTGKPVAGSWTAGKTKVAGTAQSAQYLWIAGGHAYGYRNADRKGESAPQAVGEVFTLDGRQVATNRLPCAPVSGEKFEQIIAQENCGSQSAAKWRLASYAGPFCVAGNRLFIRTNDDLWCIGAK